MIIRCIFVEVNPIVITESKILAREVEIFDYFGTLGLPKDSPFNMLLDGTTKATNMDRKDLFRMLRQLDQRLQTPDNALERILALMKKRSRMKDKDKQDDLSKLIILYGSYAKELLEKRYEDADEARKLICIQYHRLYSR